MPIEYRAGEPLTAQQIREVDVLAIEHVGLPGLVLMENAGRAAADFIYDRLVDPRHDRVLVLCGPGNNGGDGFVAARHLRNAGVSVEVVLAAEAERLRGDAATNCNVWKRMGQPVAEVPRAEDVRSVQERIDRAHFIVDALLGTGATGEPRTPLRELIQAANAANARRIAVDVPTGFDADRGLPAAVCFRAEATITFVAAKVGFLEPAAADYVGRIKVADIGVPRALVPGVTQIWMGG